MNVKLPANVINKIVVYELDGDDGPTVYIIGYSVHRPRSGSNITGRTLSFSLIGEYDGPDNFDEAVEWAKSNINSFNDTDDLISQTWELSPVIRSFEINRDRVNDQQ